jgi:hypothetical protein
MVGWQGPLTSAIALFLARLDNPWIFGYLVQGQTNLPKYKQTKGNKK